MEFWLGLNSNADIWIVDHDDGTREVRNSLGQVLRKLAGTGSAQKLRPRQPFQCHVRKASASVLRERHPRMFRACSDHSLYGQWGTLHDAWQMSRQAIRNLCLDMLEIFRRVEPDGANAGVIYGHEIRNLLALACMEVESSWKSILKANHYRSAPGRPPRFSTNDYVKLRDPLRLAEYEVRLVGYSSVPNFRPFSGWSVTDPTRSLAWYDAYNETKHDREANFRAATLLQMIHALGAAHVMMYAQFGQCKAGGVGSTDHDEFWMMSKPSWLPEERYVPPETDSGDRHLGR